MAKARKEGHQAALKQEFLREHPLFEDDTLCGNLTVKLVGQFKRNEILDIRSGQGDPVLFRVESIYEGSLGQVVLKGQLLKGGLTPETVAHEFAVWTTRHATFIRGNTGAYREITGE